MPKEPLDTGGPAFAAATCGDWQIGMTLLDYFAGQALQGSLAGLSTEDRRFMEGLSGKQAGLDILAAASYEIAAAMIARRNQLTQTPP